MPPHSAIPSAPSFSPSNLPRAKDILTSPSLTKSQVVLALAVSLVAGSLSGYLVSGNSSSSSLSSSPSVVKTSKEVGIQDTQTFRDCAQGTIQPTDPEDKKAEGSFKLIREGGDSQTVYMTSSVLALDQYLNKKVEVCGETLDSKKVAWFMDVGKLKLLE